MKKLIEFMEGTAVIWLPILAIYIAGKLQTIISGDVVMNFFWGIGVLSIVTLYFTHQYEKKLNRKERN